MSVSGDKKAISDCQNDTEAATKQRKSRGKGRPFVKGDPRINRQGKTRGQTVRSLLAQIASEEITVNKTRITKGEAILRKIVNGAVAGDSIQTKYYLEYMYGKPVQPVDIDATIKVADYDPETMAFAQKFLAGGGDSNANL